jgi:hypothetical protein
MGRMPQFSGDSDDVVVLLHATALAGLSLQTSATMFLPVCFKSIPRRFVMTLGFCATVHHLAKTSMIASCGQCGQHRSLSCVLC